MSVYRYRLTDRPETLTMIADGDDLAEATRNLGKKFGRRLVRVWSEERMMRASDAEVSPSASGFKGNLRDKSPMHAESYPARRPPCKPASSMGAA